MRHRIRRALGTLLAAGLLGSGLVALDVPAAQAAYPVPPTPSGLPAAPAMSRPVSSAAAWPPSNPPSGPSEPLAGNDQSLPPEVP